MDLGTARVVGVAQGVRQTLLHEPVGREVQTWRQCLHRTGHLELDGQARGAELRGEPVELFQPRRRFELSRLAGLAQHPHHAAHLGKSLTPHGLNGFQRTPLCYLLCGQPAPHRGGLDGHDADTVADDVVQFARDAGAFLSHGLEGSLLAVHPTLLVVQDRQANECPRQPRDDEWCEPDQPSQNAPARTKPHHARRGSSQRPTLYPAITVGSITPFPSGDPNAANSTRLTARMAAWQPSGFTRRPTRRAAVTAYSSDCAHSGPWRCVEVNPHHASSCPRTPTTTARLMSNAQFLRVTSRTYALR